MRIAIKYLNRSIRLSNLNYWISSMQTSSWKKIMVSCPSKADLTQFLISRIVALSFPQRVTVIAIDGIDLSGKTLLSNELLISLNAVQKNTVVVHEDDFATPKSVRYQQGEWSTMGFYEDFFDYKQAIRDVLVPAREGKQINISLPLFDGTSDSPYSSVHYVVLPHGYLIFEGLFLLRPELTNLFDLVIRLKISTEVVMERALVRDVPKLGNAEFVRRHYQVQPIAAQEYYEQSCDPDKRADILIDNSIIERPVVLKA